MSELVEYLGPASIYRQSRTYFNRCESCFPRVKAAMVTFLIIAATGGILVHQESEKCQRCGQSHNPSYAEVPADD